MQPKETKCVKSKSKKDDNIHNGYYQTMMDDKARVENAFAAYLDSVKRWVAVDNKQSNQITHSEPLNAKEWYTGRDWARRIGIKQNFLNSRLHVLRDHLPKDMVLFSGYRKKIPLYKAKELGEWIEKNYPGVLKPSRARGK